jgi:hypothetical protein
MGDVKDSMGHFDDPDENYIEDEIAPAEGEAPAETPDGEGLFDAGAIDDGEDEEEEGEEGEEPAAGQLPPAVYARLKRTREQRNVARNERDRLAAEAARLREENEVLQASLADPEPDFESDPVSWKAWKERDVERRLKRRAGAPAAGAERPAQSQPTELPPAEKRVADSALAARRTVADYDVVVSPIVHRLYDTDAKVRYRIQSAEDPGMEAYRVGEELIGRKKASPPPGGSSFGGGRSAPRNTGQRVKLTAEEAAVARRLGIPPKEMLAELNASARRSQ